MNPRRTGPSRSGGSLARFAFSPSPPSQLSPRYHFETKVIILRSLSAITASPSLVSLPHLSLLSPPISRSFPCSRPSPLLCVSIPCCLRRHAPLPSLLLSTALSSYSIFLSLRSAALCLLPCPSSLPAIRHTFPVPTGPSPPATHAAVVIRHSSTSASLHHCRTPAPFFHSLLSPRVQCALQRSLSSASAPADCPLPFRCHQCSPSPSLHYLRTSASASPPVCRSRLAPSPVAPALAGLFRSQPVQACAHWVLGEPLPSLHDPHGRFSGPLALASPTSHGHWTDWAGLAKP